MKQDARRFAAALKGIDLDKDNEEESAFDRIKRDADEKLSGMNGQDMEFMELGIQVEHI